MSARHTDRIWLIAGALVAAAMLAVGWFVLVGPQRSSTADLESQVGAKETEITTLQKKLVTLRDELRDKARYEGELTANRKALPVVPETAEYVRQVNLAAANASVKVTSISISDPAPLDQSGGGGTQPGAPAGATAGIFAMPISITVEGTASNLHRFLDELQATQPRAVLLSSLNMDAPENAEAAGAKGVLGLTITMQAFVAPANGGRPAASPAAAK